MKFLTLALVLSSGLAMAQNQVDRLELDSKVSLSEKLEIFANLTDGRHKFVFTEDRILIVSVGIEKRPRHGELGVDKKVITAGYISVQRAESGEITSVEIDNQSGDYCPTFESLRAIEHELCGPFVKVSLVNNPNLEKCPNETN